MSKPPDFNCRECEHSTKNMTHGGVEKPAVLIDAENAHASAADSTASAPFRATAISPNRRRGSRNPGALIEKNNGVSTPRRRFEDFREAEKGRDR
jgi:hypothetical protein